MIARYRNALWGAALIGLTLHAMPAAAQDANDAVRLRKLEAEVRALQRKVFPGGDARYFEPEIAPQQRAGTPQPSTTSTSAVTDVLARMDAMEASVQRLTAQVEQNTNTLSQLDTRLSALETTTAAAAQADATPATGEVAENQAAPARTGPATSAPAAQRQPTPVTKTAATPAPAAGPTAAHLAAVQQITKPQTDDAGDDEYSYGFRLWEAGFYPEAEQQLTMFVDKYPSHWRTTYGRNLLGRAYLDDGKPREAAAWFIKNYQADRAAARAPDSLLYLAESMIDLKDTKRACIALSEFGETYPAIATGRLQSQYEADRKKVTCKN